MGLPVRSVPPGPMSDDVIALPEKPPSRAPTAVNRKRERERESEKKSKN